MEKLSENKYPLVKQESDTKKTTLPGYPSYPPGEDLYAQSKEEEEIDPEVISLLKGAGSVDGLDVPGSELDDLLEEIGSEDEENNYYSLGGDEHDD
ncbi:MAG: hypothetical protein PHT07_22080 [Paludibacter sp.]|nr:hypothetical protein [Paludibacter sp.]